MRFLSSTSFPLLALIDPISRELGGASTLAVDAASLLSDPYHTTTDLGSPSLESAAGNPFRGFLTNPAWTVPPYKDDFDSSLEFHYIGLNAVMTGEDEFDWAALDALLNDSASREKHSIVRFQMDSPAETTKVPQFLIDGGLAFDDYTAYGGGKSPDYDDANLRKALSDFVAALGDRYDGDSRLAFLQLGLLGFWGEWHTYTDKDEGWIPDAAKDDLVESFRSAFQETPLQVRYPWPSAVSSDAPGFGYHDDSFAHSTLDGEANADIERAWFFWPSVVSATDADFWKDSVMGGELRPERQGEVFSDTYPAGTQDSYQDFDLCVSVTHATYMLNFFAFSTGYPEGTELTKAREANNRMGYAFRVSRVEVGESSDDDEAVDVAVEVTQDGIAPFYYPLDLILACGDDLSWSRPGVQSIIEQGDTGTFIFEGIPTTSECLDGITLTLDSPGRTFPGRPIKFAQGTDGTSITVSLPPPSDSSGSSDPTDDDDADASECFSGLSRVEIRDVGSVPMNQLEIGDMIAVGKDRGYEPVYSFGHKDPDATANFLLVRTTSPASTSRATAAAPAAPATTGAAALELTPYHMVYVKTRALFVPASDLRAGDVLEGGDGQDLIVESIDRVRSRGLFAPLTPSGRLVVNGIVASSFVAMSTEGTSGTRSGGIDPRPGERTFGGGLIGIPVQWLAHTIEFPHRFVCYHCLGACSEETYNERGLESGWVASVLELVRWYLKRGFAVKTLWTLVLVIPSLALFAASERALAIHPLLLLLVSGLSFAVLLSTCAKKRRGGGGAMLKVKPI